MLISYSRESKIVLILEIIASVELFINILTRTLYYNYYNSAVSRIFFYSNKNVQVLAKCTILFSDKYVFLASYCNIDFNAETYYVHFIGETYRHRSDNSLNCTIAVTIIHRRK